MRFRSSPAGPVTVLSAVIGAEFPAVLAAAQDGSEAAFARLWQDANPVLLRYLRVGLPDCAEDVAAETWLQVVRGLAGFRGDEQAWRSWLFTIARRRTRGRCGTLREAGSVRPSRCLRTLQPR